MGFLVCANLEFRDVALHRVFGQLQFDARISLAALFDLSEADRSSVGHEAAVPRMDAANYLAGFKRRLFMMKILLPVAEVIGLAVIPVSKDVIVVEDEIG